MDTTKLIVKAPNGIEDQHINCQLSWTIKKLKNYLSEVYPNKPSTDEQKLIYSGQLLNDAVVLKDVLRQYDGQETHTVHLVFTPKSYKHPYLNKSGGKMQTTDSTTAGSSSSTSAASSSPTAGADSTDGLRHRNVAGQSLPPQSTAPQRANNIPPINAAQFAANYINPNLFYNTNAMYQTAATTQPVTQQQMTMEAMAAQQLAMQNWMQMAYAQYMNQYFNMMSVGGVRPETLYMPPSAAASTTVGGGVPPNMAYMPQTLPNPASQPSPSPQVQTTPAPQPATAGAAPQPAAEPAAAGGAVGENPVNEQQAAAVARRFPNIIQEEQESRDWLDILYAICRLTILLTLVYFYSSPIRCLIVIFVGSAIYMYHIGLFRQQQRQPVAGAAQQPAQPAVGAAANQNVNGDNNNNINAAVVENADNVAGAGAGAVPATADQPLLETAAVDDTNQSNRAAHVASLVRTFVVSFICSLIPEAPAL